MIRRPPTIEQLRNIADRADRGPLAPSEVARLREGINRFDRRPDQARAVQPAAVWARKAAALRRRLTAIHHPVQRGPIAACAECSGWNGRRCTGLVTPWPCPTLETLDELFPGKETAA
ncbi:hypothetical protein C9F11_38095 [Streptomyces sp. YIM 121038]|uniref:hypothetical protein n=1 Tax=Streptomyces sp. YIM 121038 TaxID=2136401 RepID=UPI0011100C2F|nr:hypothetical protein [Streptomyces sp. YIM 121038]QCX81202.1 hypothetical protein C9F11_38095 [Streptomyces sp. YIM 121038]